MTTKAALLVVALAAAALAVGLAVAFGGEGEPSGSAPTPDVPESRSAYAADLGELCVELRDRFAELGSPTSPEELKEALPLQNAALNRFVQAVGRLQPPPGGGAQAAEVDKAYASWYMGQRLAEKMLEQNNLDGVRSLLEPAIGWRDRGQRLSVAAGAVECGPPFLPA